MAIEVSFIGYINEVKKFEWGTVYDIAHAQRKSNDRGEWETVGYDYFSVVGEPGLEKGQRVAVNGKLKTKRYDKADGSKGISLEIRADDIVLDDRFSNQNQEADAPF